MYQLKLVAFVVLLTLTINLSCVENTTTNVESAGKLAVGETVPDVEIPKLLQAGDRQSITLGELKGSTVILEFWATWCPPCIAAIPHMNDLVDEFSGDPNVKFISVSDEPESTVSAFLKRQSMHAWIGLDQKGELHDAFGVDGIPLAIIIDAEGKLVKVLHPMQLDAKLIRQIRDGQ